MENKICVYAICKNEAQFVERWVKSMSEADSIVALDTGSTDDTVEKLKNLGVKVEQKIISPWSFGDARNESMKLIPEDCNILVCTDLDEYFEPGWGEVLRKNWIEGVHTRCHYKYYIRPDQEISYDKIHKRGYYWKYAIHEILYSDDMEKDTSENQLNLYFDITLHHTPDRSKDRTNYFDLLKVRANADTSDFMGIIYYISECFYKGLYNDILELYGKINIEDCNNDIFKLSLYDYKGQTYLNLNNKEKAIECFKKCLDINNEYRIIYYNFSKCYSAPFESYKILIEGLKNSKFHYNWYETAHLWNDGEYYDALSLAAFYSGNIVESLAYAMIAYKKNPENERYKTNIDAIMNFITDEEIIKFKNQQN